MWASGPKCPDCNKAFTTDFIDSTFSKGFRRGPLRIASIENLQEQEMSLLPETMTIIKERNDQLKYNKIYKQITDIQAIYNAWISTGQPVDFDRYQSEQRTLHEALLQIPFRRVGQKRQRNEAAHKSIKCPGEACLGYIAMSGVGSGSCGLCDMRVCKDCNKALANADAVKDHTACNPDDVKSWTLIKETSVSCPKCGTPIQKVSGCNQMWCTVTGCNTAFDWATGRIVNGPFHNPHYHEWLRTSGGATAAGGLQNANLACQGPGDVLSNHNIQIIYGLMDYQQTILNYNYNRMPYYRKLSTKLSDCLRCLSELVDGRYGPRAEHAAYGPQTHQDLRIDYLEKKITKAAWASKLSHRETLRIKYARQRAIYAMFQTAAADLFAQFLTTMTNMSQNDTTSRRTKSTQNYRSKVLDPEACVPVMESFIDSINNLRIYHIRESIRIIKDYSDSSIRIMHYEEGSPTGVQFYWVNSSVRDLQTLYMKDEPANEQPLAQNSIYNEL